MIKLAPDDTLYDPMQFFDLKGIEEIPVVESLGDPWVLVAVSNCSYSVAQQKEDRR